MSCIAYIVDSSVEIDLSLFYSLMCMTHIYFNHESYFPHCYFESNISSSTNKEQGS
jgi:hypothetical protein